MRARIEKRDHNGGFVWAYDGVIVSRDALSVVVEARMNRDIPTPYLYFRTGDRMIESFYVGRWYNIMEVRDVDDDRLKGWYCNITRPPHVAELPNGVIQIVYEDVALDAFIDPVGELLVLDEDELAALQLPADDVTRAWAGLASLREQLERRLPPFDGMNP